jgi:hypothetical protein
MYMRMRPRVMVSAQVKKTFSGPQIRIMTKNRTCTPTSKWMALSGVLRPRSTRENHFGRVPERPIAYQVLVPPLKQAIDTAKTELSSANRTSTQAPPHTSVASVNTGNASASGMPAALLTPIPTR